MPQGNNSIGCTVSECKHHAKNVQQCALQHIEVVKHSQGEAQNMHETDCASFEPEDNM
ncbi:MAG: DUF1540 domain-containing protein [Proteobacteria bacterium]|nr:DUF1540 domain-containing protein [Pseudomonadota bacterium]